MAAPLRCHRIRPSLQCLPRSLFCASNQLLAGPERLIDQPQILSSCRAGLIKARGPRKLKMLMIVTVFTMLG